MQTAWQSGQVPSAGNYPGFPMQGFPTPYDPWGAAQVSPEQELDMLKAQANEMDTQLKQINGRIKELEKKEEK
jgi:hypothetical protein